jgi:hypothetical protein
MVSLRTMLGRALIGGALLLPAAAVLAPTDAAASVSIAVQYEQLVKDADLVAVITPGEAKSVWEDGRIYTYTEVHVDQPVAGDVAAGHTAWVRTMGGVVGQVGQLVDGEPVFTKEKSSLLFLRKFNANRVYEVSARAQGQYPVVIDPQTKQRKIIRATSVGMLLPPRTAAAATEGPPVAGAVQTKSVGANAPTSELAKLRLAQEVMHDRPLDEIARELATTWKRLHPAPPAK